VGTSTTTGKYGVVKGVNSTKGAPYRKAKASAIRTKKGVPVGGRRPQTTTVPIVGGKGGGKTRPDTGGSREASLDKRREKKRELLQKRKWTEKRREQNYHQALWLGEERVESAT